MSFAGSTLADLFQEVIAARFLPDSTSTCASPAALEAAGHDAISVSSPTVTTFTIVGEPEW